MTVNDGPAVGHSGPVTRAATGKPGPHSVVFDLLADDGTYFVLTETLADWADAQRTKAENEGGNDQRDQWAHRAEALLAMVETAMDGEQ